MQNPDATVQPSTAAVASRPLRAFMVGKPDHIIKAYLDFLIPGSGKATVSQLDDIACTYVPDKLRRHVIRQWVQKVENFWSAGRCAYTKGRMMVSNARWLLQANVMFRTYVPGDGKKKARYVAKKIDGVAMPCPKGRWSIDKVRAEGRVAAGVATANGGLTAYRKFTPCLEKRWNRVLGELTQRHGPQVPASEHLQSVDLNVWSDKANARGARAGTVY